MEKAPLMKSCSKYYELTNIDSLNNYVLALDKVINNPHKYAVVDNDIRFDIFGNPFVIFQYSDKPDMEEKKKKQYSFFGEIISIANLERYDDLTNKHWAKEIVITFIKEYSTKDKENPMHYKLVIYYKVNDGNILESEKAKSIMPVDRKG
jgi:hypothetical protein